MTNNEKALQMHKEWNGKLETTAKAHVNSREDLAIAYTPGVAEPCKVIAKDPEAAYTYTMKANTVAVVSDGSAVLGLGNIGALAAMPVMEGKCVLFKEFGGVNAVPICLDTQDTEEIIRSVVNIAPAFGGINLEDISAPRCFEIETRLKELLNIPVFHDDQHGTAIVVLAGIINALKVTGKKKEEGKTAAIYLTAITSFAIGAACGGHLTTYFSYRTIWISCGILILCFLLMLIEEEEDLEVLEKKERKELQAEKNLVKKEQEKLQEEKLLMKETENEFQQKISKG